jgi:hypothetical protein
MSLQSTHTTTVNSLQRELEALRETHRLVKIQLRDLEMGNDDLERHERFVPSIAEAELRRFMSFGTAERWFHPLKTWNANTPERWKRRFFSSTNYRTKPLWKRICSVFATN